MKIVTIKVGNMDNNCYLLIHEQAGQSIVIDPGFDCDTILSAIEESNTKLLYILLTHRHFDHILAAKELKEKTGAKICIHPKDACGLSSAGFSMANVIGVTQSALPPDFTFVEGDRIKFGDTSIIVMDTPGHTIGSVCFLWGSNLFTGDTLFRLGQGRTDFPTGNEEQMKRSLKLLANLPGDYKVLPGHGKPSTLDVERTCNPFVLEALKS